MNRRSILSSLPAGLAAAAPASGEPPAGGPHIYDVRRLGASGTGKTLDTAVLNRAIDACSASGGGVVYLPPGSYLTGTVVLKSNVTLYLEAGATLLGSTDIRDYSGNPADARNHVPGSHLISARNAENIALAGPGRIDGQGKAFWQPSGRPPMPPENAWRDAVHNQWKTAADASGRERRPSPMIELVDCRHVRIEDVRIENAAGWTLRPLNCDDVTIRGIRIWNPTHGPNTDGIDPTGCRNVFISDCLINTGDDNICLKSENPYGEDIRVSKNITITNCVLSGGCNGLKFGTATRGGFENVVFSNCVIANDDVPVQERLITGIAIEMVDGGWLEGVLISNVRIQRARTPIFMRRGLRRARPDGSAGTLRGVKIDNVHATGSILSSLISGVPGFDIEDVSLTNIRVDSEEGGEESWVARPIPEVPTAYPDVRPFGRLPAFGLYCRHVSGLNLQNVEFRAVKKDARPALICDDVSNLSVDGFTCSAASGAQPAIRLINARSAFLRGCRAPAGSQLFLEVQGRASERITLLASDLTGAREAVRHEDEVPPGAVTESR
ncbi:MAG: glycoside hydrolase family 28 protein [Acidobacteria bacterium]|nr:glycoside hydrolase family 28 protein [Acidobacteriota bacterium]